MTSAESHRAPCQTVQAIGPFGTSFLLPNRPKSHIVMICTGGAKRDVQGLMLPLRDIAAAGPPPPAGFTPTGRQLCPPLRGFMQPVASGHALRPRVRKPLRGDMA